MSLTTIVLIAGASWSVLSISVGIPLGRGIKRADRRPQSDPVFRIVSCYPPAVPAPVTPPFTQAIPDASWFDGMPVEILSDDAAHSLFDRLVDLDENLRDLA